MKKFVLLFLLIPLISIKVQAILVEAPTLEGLITKMDTQINTNLRSQYIQITETLTTLGNQLQEAKRMAKSLADG
ncbi:MAG: hypothetical protein LBH40_01460, partial [Alphaproteobacteria bacterium]|nr:hypothetical protein [Alphaproteobacteria bacterium]